MFDPNNTMPIDVTHPIFYEVEQVSPGVQRPTRQREEGEPPAWVLFTSALGAVVVLVLIGVVGLTVLLN